MGMDYKDLRIIEILKGNSREPVKLIAKKTGMRPSTVHQRIQKLIKSRAIDKFTIKLDNKAVGENFIAFILVDCAGPHACFFCYQLDRLPGISFQYFYYPQILVIHAHFKVRLSEARNKKGVVREPFIL